MISLYLSQEVSKGRKFISDWDIVGIWLGFDMEEKGSGHYSQSFLEDIANFYTDYDKTYPWHKYKMERGFASFLSFLIRLQNTLQNKTVIQFMSGQLDYSSPGSDENKEAIRDSIRANNYYGYTVLREFCENPGREMPTLEKTGTSFKGVVKEQSALLYLEPFADSYDIDTIRPNETFTAYEMGHDGYFFVEAIKPVESPVAGPDGYAAIIDRTETVYGYMKKTEVIAFTGEE